MIHPASLIALELAGLAVLSALTSLFCSFALGDPASRWPRWLAALAAASALALGMAPVSWLPFSLEHQRALILAFLWAGAGLALVAAAAALRANVPQLRGGETTRASWLDAAALAAVAAWSLCVRLVWTEPNILTDGGSGVRLIDSVNSGSVNLLVRAILPESLQGLMWPAIRVVSVVCALAPPLLVALARSLGLRRTWSLLAGLMLASLPLHAAMYSSDFLNGAILTVLLLAMVCLQRGATAGAPLAVIAGLVLYAFVIWGRPETIIFCAIPAVLAWRIPPAMWRNPFVVLAATALGLSMGLRWKALPSDAEAGWDGPWGSVPLDFLWDGITVPWWLWLPAPLGFFRLPSFVRVLVVAGVLVGVVPVHRIATDPTGSYLELFRYGTQALPWIVLCAAAGFAFAAELASRVLRLRGRRRAAPLVAAALAVVATPLLHLDYLGRRYGPAVERRTFAELLERVPEGYVLVVPDDFGNEDTHDVGLREVFKFYELVADELRRADRNVPELLPITTELARRAPAGRPRYYFRGAYCTSGRFDGKPSTSCARLEERYRLREVWSRTVPFFHHRLVSRPASRSAPWFAPATRLALYELLPR